MIRVTFGETSVAVAWRRDRGSTRAEALSDCLVSGGSLPAGFHILSPLSIIVGLWPEYYYSHFTDREPDSDWAGYLPTEPSYPGLPGTKAWGDTRPLGMTPS